MPATSREIFNAQMNFRGFERSFFMEESFTDETYRLWPIFSDNGITDRWSAFRHLGMDILYKHWGHEVDSPTFLMPWYKQGTISETQDTKIIRGSYGTLEEKFKDGREGGRLFSPAIVAPDDWAKIKAERFIIDDPRRDLDIDKIKKEYSPDMPFGLFAGSLIGLSRFMLTLEGAIYACYDYPEMIEDMVETNCLLIERYIDHMLPHFDVDIAFIYENITCKNGPTLPVWVIRDIIAPRMKRVCKKLKSFNVGIISLCSDGDIRPILPIFFDSGINWLSFRKRHEYERLHNHHPTNY